MTKAAKSLRFDYVSEASTTESVALAYAELLEEGRPLDSIPQELAALETLRLEDLDAEARSGLYAWDGLLVVLVGDKDAVLPQLKAEGFPEPALVDPEGRPL
jgi:hypothetical protein